MPDSPHGQARSQSAIDQIVSASAEARPLRREECGKFRHLFGRADTANWVSVAKALKDLFQRNVWRELARSVFEYGRPNGTRANGVNAHAIFRMVQRKCARQAVNCTL